MTFRAPLRRKWFYPFVLCACAAIAIVSFRAGLHSPRPVEDYFEAVFATLFGVFVVVTLSWRVWTARVTVDDIGVRWKEGGVEQSLRWEEVSRLAQDGITIALVERGSSRPIPLPFVSRPLYAALTQRLNPLSAEEERILFS